MCLPERPVGVAAEDEGNVGTGGGYTGSQHSLSGNSLAPTYILENKKFTIALWVLVWVLQK